MIKISVEMAKLLHRLIAEETGGSTGVRDEGLLDAALESAFAACNTHPAAANGQNVWYLLARDGIEKLKSICGATKYGIGSENNLLKNNEKHPVFRILNEPRSDLWYNPV